MPGVGGAFFREFEKHRIYVHQVLDKERASFPAEIAVWVEDTKQVWNGTNFPSDQLHEVGWKRSICSPLLSFHPCSSLPPFLSSFLPFPSWIIQRPSEHLVGPSYTQWHRPCFSLFPTLSELLNLQKIKVCVCVVWGGAPNIVWKPPPGTQPFHTNQVTHSLALPRAGEFSRTLAALTGPVPRRQGQFWSSWDSWSPTYLQKTSMRRHLPPPKGEKTEA